MARDSRADVVRLRGVAPNHGAARALLERPGDAAIVERGVPRMLLLRCPCGCGDEVAVNLDGRVGPAWRLFRRARGLTLYPSVWRESGCLSHFIIWNDQVLGLADRRWTLPPDPGLEARLLARFRPGEAAHFEALAEELGEDPWAVRAGCLALVRAARLHEGTGARRGWFSLAP